MSESDYLIKPILATPRSVALFMTGYTFYVGFIDPVVRRQLINPRHQLKHWATSFGFSAKLMPALGMFNILSGLCAYWKTKEKLWLGGTALAAFLIPYTLLMLGNINRRLLELNLNQGDQMDANQSKQALQKMDSWVKRHRHRIIMCFISAFIFYFAEVKSAQK